VKNCILNHIF